MRSKAVAEEERAISRGRHRERRSKVAHRSASESTCRWAARRSGTTPRRATRWSRCRCRRGHRPPFSKPEACDGWWARRYRRRVAPRARCRAGAPPSRAVRPCSIACRRAHRVAFASRHHGSSPRTSSPTHHGVCPEARRPRRSRMEARSAASFIRSRRSRLESSPTDWDARCGWCIRVRMSCGSDRNVRPSPPLPSHAATSCRSRVWRRWERKRVYGRHRQTSTCRRGGPRHRCAGREWPPTCARPGSPSRRCSSPAHCAETSTSSHPAVRTQERRLRSTGGT